MNGIINFLKPSGMTSSDAVVIVKKALHTKKVGHLGTLDPMAVGVLPIAVGNSTKLFDLFLKKKKLYRAFFDFSFTTDTLDTDGVVTKRCEKKVTKEDIERILPDFIGKMQQMPPLYSAKNIDGKRAYDLARRGEKFQLKSSEVEIFDITLVRSYGENAFIFDIECSAGTFIRSIVRDMGEKLSSCGVMTALIRMKSGDFGINDAATREEVIENPEKYLISPENTLSFLDKIDFFDEKTIFQIRNGVKLDCEREDGYYTIYFSNEFYGLTKVYAGKMQNYLNLQ